MPFSDWIPSGPSVLPKAQQDTVVIFDPSAMMLFVACGLDTGVTRLFGGKIGPNDVTLASLVCIADGPNPIPLPNSSFRVAYGNPP
jgi:hypothetical protein